MGTARLLIAPIVVATAVAFPAVSHAALSRAAGGSGYSGTLSSKPAVRQQQLICDPVEPIRGSTSVLYESELVTLDGFQYGPGYGPLNGLTAVVEVQVGKGTRLQNLASFLDNPQGSETGYVQVYYELIGGAGQIAPDGTVLDEDPGPGFPGEGVDTHAFLFTERAFRLQGGNVSTQGVFPVVVATYTIYADEGNRPSGNRRDFLTGRDDAGELFTLTPRQLESATVTSPEPSGLALVALAGAGLLRRRRSGDR